MGLAGLQVTRLKNNLRTYNRNQAKQVDYNLTDRIRTNVAEVAPYTTILPSAAIKLASMRGKTVYSLGFTLVELMITVAIVGILAAIAAPSFQDMLNQTRASSLANELAASLNLARSEAIKRGTQVTVCKSGNITAASPTCSTTASWQDGWLIFVDTGTSGTFDGTDTRLKVGQPSNSSAVITAGSTFAHYVSYLSSGMSKGSSLPNGSLVICVNHVERSIIINTTGRNRFSKGVC
jgi:type IV fimbrial biogenesis protein FimT